MKMKKNMSVLDHFEGLTPDQIREMRERTLRALEEIRADIDRKKAEKNYSPGQTKPGGTNE